MSLWVTIQFGFKAPMFAAETAGAASACCYLESFIEPFGTLWFIYLLPIFFVVIKADTRIPCAGDLAASAAALEMAHIDTGWTVIDEFCARFVYFYSGYLFAPYVFALSDRARSASRAGACRRSRLWALVNAGLVWLGAAASGRSCRSRSASPAPAPSS